MTAAAPATARARSARSESTAQRLAAHATVPAVLGLTLVAAALRLVHLGQVPGNPFYDAAIRTMAGSWHAFIFGALDPAGSVSVDKPPVDLWLQVASVKILGFSLTALKLPQALAGAASVPLLYDLVRRGFGRGAGLAAAASLAVLPVAVLTARSDTMDTVMTFLLLVGAWLVVRAIETNRLPYLLAAGAAVGLAFNVKLFEALLPLPALALLWLVGSRASVRRRLGGLAAAGAVMAVVSFAWIVPVALTPASQRPYPIGSTNGSVWNLVFVFNGIGRLNGRPATTPDTLPASSRVSAAVARAQRHRVTVRQTTRGPKRLFGRRFGARIGSELLPAILFGALAALLGAVAAVRRRRDAGPAAEPRLPFALALFTGVWLVMGYGLFSAMGIFHPRYFDVVTPAVAAALGIGAWALVRGPGRLRALLAGAALVACCAYGLRLGQPATVARDIALPLGAAALAALAAVAILRSARPAVRGLAAGLLLATVLAIPAGVSAEIVHLRASDAERSGEMPHSWPPLLNRYLRAHRGGARYLVASIAPAKVAPLIVDDPQPVLMLTSYRSRPLLSVPQLEAKVRAGEVRYFLLGRRCTSKLTAHTAACPATARWVRAHATDVTPATGLGHHGLLYRVDLCPVSSPAPAAATARGRGRSATSSGRRSAARRASRPRPATCVPRRSA